MLHWRLQWRGPRTRKKKSPPDDFERGPRWYDVPDIGEAFTMLDEGLGGFVVALLAVSAIVIAILFVVPAFILLVEVLLVALVIVGAVAIRILFRQPWLVDAIAEDETHLTWKVNGYRASRRVVDEISGLLASGVRNPTARNALLVR